MGLLAWSAEPGDGGLLLCPGEQDGVTEDEEKHKQGEHNAASSGTLRQSPSNICPQRDFTLSRPSSHLPTSCHISISTGPQRGSHYKCSPQTRPWRVAWLVLQVPDLLKQEGQMPKLSYSRTHPGLGICSPKPRGGTGKRTRNLRKEERSKERKVHRQRKENLRAQLKIASLSSVPISTNKRYMVF